ncbi:EAL domain-containing protein [Romboutsia weinsteinii]|uniref:EAL domain-containing protein n=1 Tax=Romboutsia weinsteinii TaxID=2020949 RepID=A0A371J421_9FIRM|nr:EAL domain-containing protein [Romboutsia weinsteinii]RDY27424.1 EAL domain-containing protein [Romboutsia weinsteinii]
MKDTFDIYNDKGNLFIEVINAIKNKEFKIVYQPKFNINSMNIVGVEALIRWEKNNGDIVYPDLFIPQLEINKDIYLIDYFVLENCVMKINQWIKLKIKPIPIAINISKSTIMRREFISKLKYFIEKYDIPEGIFELEITERECFYKDIKNIAKKIKKIKELGVRVSLDDFGSGNSNILAVANIDFDYIKIDKSILDEIGNNKIDNILVGIKNIMDMNKVFVVAEGIETKYQYEKLLNYGYSYAQGYYFSKPITIEQLESKYLLKDS